LKQAQENHNVIEAEVTLKEAYETDVRGILREVRKEKELPEGTIKYVKGCDEYWKMVRM
jgi:L-rhamnose isomerase/sugar isomerase